MTNNNNNDTASTPSNILRRCACLLGASGVTLGAFGAHALKNTLSCKPGAADNWKTAVTYQLFHACALLALSPHAVAAQSRLKDKIDSTLEKNNMMLTGGKMMFAGTILFSGSIYGLCLDVGPKKLLGPITPLGGLLMIGGWIYIGISA
eukprot:7567298-Ditylum_brightwellii.AAC.1